MSKREVMKCPKCKGEMKSGYMCAGWIRGDIDLFARGEKDRCIQTQKLWLLRALREGGQE